MTVAEKTRTCRGCGVEKVYERSDRCPTCQRNNWLEQEYALIEAGGEAMGYVPPQVPSVWVIDNGVRA